MTIRLNGRLQSPALTLCEELAAEFGPPKREPRATDRPSDDRERWTLNEAAEDAAKARLSRIFTEREEIGMARYGAPLDPGDLSRRWVPEMLEELADAAVYATAEMRLLAPEKRTNPDAKHRWLEMSRARRDICKLMVKLIQLGDE